jgi:hypothetical protein
MTRDATRPNKPDELLLWLRDRYPNATAEELTKRFRELARDDIAIVDRLSDFFLGLNFNRLLKPSAGAPASITGRKRRAAKARELACGQMGGSTYRTAESR